jgi:hypothetical protein
VTDEIGPVEHEPNDVSRCEELPEAVPVDVFDVRRVQRAKYVCVELPERLRRKRVEDVD